MQFFLRLAYPQKRLGKVWVVVRGVQETAERTLIVSAFKFLVADIQVPPRLQRIQHILFRGNRFIFFRKVCFIRQLLLGVFLRGRRRWRLRPYSRMTNQKA